MDDKELLELLKRSPEKGLAETVMRYSAYLMKIAYVKLGDVCTREDIEEAVSDIFLLFYENGRARSFEIRSVRGLLSVIAERHCIDLFRKYSKRQQELNYDELEETLPAQDDLTNTELIEAVKQLGEPDEYIFIRKYYFGQKSSDIAKDLGMKTNTVNKRISRGLDRLRKILEEGK